MSSRTSSRVSSRASSRASSRPVSAEAPPAFGDAYLAAVDADSPIHHWRMDDTSGVAVDRAGSENLTASGAPTYSDYGAIPGQTGIRLPADTDYFRSTSAQSFLANAAWTVEFWFQADAAALNGSSGYIFSAANSGSERVAIVYQGTTGRILTSADDGGNKASASSEASYGWVHVVRTSAGDLYVNGVASVATNGVTLLSTAQLAIGKEAWFSNVWNGLIADVAIYDGVLSSARVSAHYSAARPDDGDLSEQQTLLWTAEGNEVDSTVAGAPIHVDYFPSNLLASDQAYTGTQSVKVDAGFEAAKIWNDNVGNYWFSLSRGTFKFFLRYATLPAGQDQTLVFIDGKTGWSSSPLKGESSLALRWDDAESNYSLKYAGVTLTGAPALSAGAWMKVVVRWDVSGVGGNTLQFEIDGNVYSSSSALNTGALDINEFHSILMGHDLTATPETMWLDSFEAWNYWNAAA